MEQEISLSKNEIKRLHKRKKLVSTAIDLFIKKGYHNCRIEDIAAKAKVGKGTFYLYFKNKEDMVAKLCDELADEIMDTLNWVKENMSEDATLADIFREEATRLVKTFDRNQKLAWFIQTEGRSVSRIVNDKINSLFNDLTDMSETTLAMGMAAGMLPTQHPRVAAMCVIGGITQIYWSYLEGKWEGSIDDLIEASLTFFYRALGVKLPT